MPKPRKQILLTNDLKALKSPATRDSSVANLPNGGSISVSIPEPPTPLPVKSPASSKKPDAPTASEIMEKLKFSPLEELIQLYKEDAQTVMTKDGTLVRLPLDPALKIKILSELAAYNHSKSKPVDMGNSAEKSVTVNIAMFQPPNK